MIHCPYCNYEGSKEKFSLLRDPWKFRFYRVMRLKCPKCGGIFNYYTGTSARGKLSMFVVRR